MPKGGGGQFPLRLSSLRTQLVSVRTQVPSLASLSGLRIQCCHELCRSQMHSDLAWQWCRLAAAALIQPLAWKFPYASGAAVKKKILKMKKKKPQTTKTNRQNGVCFITGDLTLSKITSITGLDLFLVLSLVTVAGHQERGKAQQNQTAFRTGALRYLNNSGWWWRRGGPGGRVGSWARLSGLRGRLKEKAVFTTQFVSMWGWGVRKERPGITF